MSSIPTHETKSPRRSVAQSRPPQSVLIIDDDPNVREAISLIIDQPNRHVFHAADATEAALTLASETIDLCLVDITLPDGNGIALVEELSQSHPLTKSILITGQATVDHAVEALRAGAVDFIAKPLNNDDLEMRVNDALKVQHKAYKQDQRLDRLRTLCKQLNKARHEITQQVDILCNDLVIAYQELASQMQSMEVTSDLRADLQGELDLEQVIRRTLEFIVNKVGPTNAVLFLPNPGGGYTVGGYVNYSHEKDSHKVYTDQIATHIAPLIAETEGVVHFQADELHDWLDVDNQWLENSSLIAAPCKDEEGEVLASLMLDRDNTEPFDLENVELIEAMAPLLAKHLVKVISVHHRCSDFFEDEEDGDILPF